MPKGQKRPADVIGAAVMVGRIATGEIKDTGADPSKAHGRAGGKGSAARAAVLTPQQWSEIAKKAAAKRRNID